MDLKLLQTDVAKMLNVTPDCITYWENNRTQPQVSYFPRIIEFLELFPFEFDASTLIGKLKAYRYRNGLSHRRLGEILNVDTITIRGWESGKRKPLKGMLAKLNKVFDNSANS